MKPLNHKKRKSAIWKFWISLVPVVTLICLFIYLFCITANEHANFIKEKYNYQRETFAKQAVFDGRIDSLIALLDRVRNRNMNPNEYKEIHKMINRKIQTSLNGIKYSKENKPYQLLFEQSRITQSVLDSAKVLESELGKTRKQLVACQRFYKNPKNKKQ